MRDKFAEVLNRLSESNQEIVILAADISPVGKMSQFVEKYPDKFLNVGVSEQSMIGIAAGLAMGGFRPFCYTIATFSVLRPFEFIRNDLGYQDLPVVVVGMGSGLSYPSLGFTHHAVEDIAVCSTIPNLEIWTPCDPNSVEFALNEILKNSSHPVYLRLGKAGEPNLEFATDYLPEFGYGRLFRNEHSSFDIFFVTYGPITKQVIDAALELESLGFSSQVLSMLNLDSGTFHKIAESIPKNCLVVVVEEHISAGGLASQLSLFLMNAGLKNDFLNVCIPAIPTHFYGTQNWLFERLGLDSKAITRKVADFLSTKPRRYL